MRNRRAVVLGLLVGLVALQGGTGCKGDSPKPSTRSPWGEIAPPGPIIERPLFWSATRDGHTTYLLGTFHLGVDAELQLPPWVIGRLDAAPAFAMETDGSALGAAQVMRADGGSLERDLGPAYWAKLEAAITPRLARGLDGMKPFIASMFVGIRALPWRAPMDEALRKRAARAGKPVVFLEDAAVQMALFDDTTIADVKATLDDVPRVRRQMAAALAAYERGDEAAIGQALQDRTLWVAAGRDPAGFEPAMKALLTDRNRAWLPALEELHAAGGGFVAVGAGHLIGPGSVVDLLTTRGYTVTRAVAP